MVFEKKCLKEEEGGGGLLGGFRKGRIVDRRLLFEDSKRNSLGVRRRPGIETSCVAEDK